MKKQILEVQNYFADKLARGLYKVTEIDEHWMIVSVDKIYLFTLWYCNGPTYFKTYDGRGNFMHVVFTKLQQANGYKKAMKHVNNWQETKVRNRELAELKKLQEKYPEVK